MATGGLGLCTATDESGSCRGKQVPAQRRHIFLWKLNVRNVWHISRPPFHFLLVLKGMCH